MPEAKLLQQVADTLTQFNITYTVLDCTPDLADTAIFCEHYHVPLEHLTGMMIGGVTAIGITDMPCYVDSAIMQQSEIVMGGGNRSSKLLLDPHELLKLPNVEIVENLARPKE